MTRFTFLTIVSMVALAACEPTSAPKETPAAPTETGPDEPTDEPTGEPSPEPESSAATSTTTRWLAVEAPAMNGAQQAQFDRAVAAQQELGTSLLKALSTSIGEKGVPDSIAFCKNQAPMLTRTVGETRGVAIGRTSAKLRNPSNSGPEWIDNAIGATTEPRRAAFAGPNGELGMIAPIKTAELCTKCHGTDDAVATEVAKAIDEHYPDDQARGFREGDLRGWFWVEVPPPS